MLPSRGSSRGTRVRRLKPPAPQRSSPRTRGPRLFPGEPGVVATVAVVNSSTQPTPGSGSGIVPSGRRLMAENVEKMTMAERLWEHNRKRWRFVLVFCTLLGGWSLYNLYQAVAHGLILGRPPGGARWVSVTENPWTFWFAVPVYVIGAIALVGLPLFVALRVWSIRRAKARRGAHSGKSGTV
jgi:hypothetical protein